MKRSTTVAWIVAGFLMMGLFTAATSGTGGVPHWLILRVHSLVVSDQSQTAQLNAQQTQIAALTAQVADLATQLHCYRSLPVTVGHVRTINGNARYLLRVPVPVGNRPFADLVRTAC
jgi:hypothetical protein